MRIQHILIASLVSMSPLGAQSLPAPPCDYDACALRQDGTTIRRGMAGDRVARMGIFSATNLVSVVRGDSATAHAAAFNHDYRRGTRLVWTGALLSEIPLAVVYHRLRQGRSFNGTDGLLTGVAFSGIVVTQVGSRALKRARTAASKAIWWHNRELPR